MKEEMKNPVADEKEDKKGNISWRVDRGGSWNLIPTYVRSAQRNNYAPSRRSSLIGFRIVRNKQ